MADTSDPKMVFIINSESMGQGDEVLGAKLLGNFFRTLLGLESKPESIVFYNAAVKALGPESPHLDALKALEDAGIDLLACVTCLEFFHLTEKLAVGMVSNMREITQCLMAADRTITV